MEAIKNKLIYVGIMGIATSWVILGILTLLFGGLFLFWSYQWWGILGAIGAFLLLPLSTFFPIIFYFKAGFYPLYVDLGIVYLVVFIIYIALNAVLNPSKQYA